MFFAELIIAENLTPWCFKMQALHKKSPSHLLLKRREGDNDDVANAHQAYTIRLSPFVDSPHGKMIPPPREGLPTEARTSGRNQALEVH